MNWIMFFVILLKSVLFSTGGYGPLPILHTDFIANKWASEKQFTESMSIGQITPGPNGLWVVCLCFLIGGFRGALLACIALLLPPLLILVVQYFYKRVADYPATQGLLDGVVLVITSFNVIVVLGMFLSNGINKETLAIAAVSAILAISRRISVKFILFTAAVIGVVFG